MKKTTLNVLEEKLGTSGAPHSVQWDTLTFKVKQIFFGSNRSSLDYDEGLALATVPFVTHSDAICHFNNKDASTKSTR